MLVAMAMVMMYLLCIDDYYRVLRWIGFDLMGGAACGTIALIIFGAMGAQLSLLELRARLRGGGDDVRHRRALPRRGADHAEKGDRQGAAEKAAVPHGTVRVEQSRRTLVHS